MRILHTFKAYRPDQDGGIGEAIFQIAAGTPASSQSSILVCRTNGIGSATIVNGIPVHRTSTFGQISSLPISPGYIPRLRRDMRDADVVVLHAPFPLADIGLGLGCPDRTALVVHWHAEIVGRAWLRPVFGPLLRHTVKRADAILVTNSVLVDESPYLRPARDKCHVVPYGIDTDFWTKLTRDDEREIANLRTRHPRLLVGCGRLVPYKGFDVLIRAMQSIDAHLIIIGTGPLEAALRTAAISAGVADRLTFAGFLSREEQRCVLCAARVFVLPSISVAETFGIVQLEAMCCGLPVVNTSLPTGVPHVARHGREGLTVEPRDERALATAITSLLNDPERAEALGAAGKKRAGENYGWQSFAANSIAQYRTAVEKRHGSRIPGPTLLKR